MKNNKGFTYVELILVIGIMVLVTGLVTISIGLISRNNVTKAGDKISSKVSEARMMTIAKGVEKGAAILEYQNGNYYCVLDGEQYKVASDPISISVIKDDGTVISVADAGSVPIKFSRNTGGLYSSNTDYDILRIENSSGGKKVEYKFQKISGKLTLL